MTDTRNTITVVVIPADINELTQVRTVGRDLASLQALVDGDIECLPGEQVTLIGNECARLIQTPEMSRNLRATLVGMVNGVQAAYGPSLCGPIVVAGGVTDEGEQLGLDPETAARIALELDWGNPTRATVAP